MVMRSKQFMLSILVGTGLLVVIVFFPRCCQAAKLRYKFEVGTSLKYKTILSERDKPDSKGRTESLSFVIAVLKALDNGEYMVSYWRKDITEEAVRYRERSVFFAVVDSVGRFRDIKVLGPDLRRDLIPPAVGPPPPRWLTLPKKSLNVGDSWKAWHTDYTFSASVERNGYKCAKIHHKSVTKEERPRKSKLSKSIDAYFAIEEGILIEFVEDDVWTLEGETTFGKTTFSFVGKKALPQEELGALLEKKKDAIPADEYERKYYLSEVKKGDTFALSMGLRPLYWRGGLSKEAWLEILAGCLKDKRVDIRHKAVILMIEMVEKDKRLTTYLIPMLEDNEPKVVERILDLLPDALRTGRRKMTKDELKNWWEDNKAELQKKERSKL